MELQVAQLKIQADVILAELEGYKKKGNRDEYNRKVEEYNSIANQINTIIAQLKSMVNQYNQQVKIFNACIGQ